MANRLIKNTGDMLILLMGIDVVYLIRNILMAHRVAFYNKHGLLITSRQAILRRFFR